MSAARRSDGGERDAADSPPHADEPRPSEELGRVRDILLGSERERLDALEARTADRDVDADEVARVLPEAVAKRASSDPQLATALQPTIENSIEASIRRNPKPLTDAIFPIIGPAIRRSIQASLSSILENFNYALESSLSPRGIGWRLEAYRTGRPFSEVVLSHTLVYRVEQVLLIDRNSGLLLERAVAPGTDSGESELVSGMLTAIQDFVSDSFAEGAGLQQVRFGERRLLVSRGPHAVVSAVVRGMPPASVETRVVETVEEIHRQFGDMLAAFDGDTDVFAVTRPQLEACLDEERRDPAHGGRRFKPGLLVSIAAFLGLTLWVASMLFSAAEQRRAWRRAVALFDAEPGLVLISRDEFEGKTRLAVLQDPDARDVATVIEAAGLDPAQLIVSADGYLSLEPEIIAARIERALDPPSGVHTSFEDGALSLAGSAPHAWILHARERAGAIPGVDHIDTSELADDDADSFSAALRALEEAVLVFAVNSTALEPDAPGLHGLLKRLERLDEAAGRSARTYRVQFSGSASTGEWKDGNGELAQRRAEALRALAAPRLSHAVGIETSFPDSSDAELRFAPEVRIIVTAVAAPERARGD